MPCRTDSTKGCRFPDPSTGFTLIEILVVVSVISILMALLMPALRKARRSAEQAACLSNIHQVTFGFFAYSLDNKVIPGSIWQGQMAATTPGMPVNLDWGGRNNQLYVSNPSAYTHPLQTSVLLKYIGTDRVLTCPTGGRPNQFFDYTMVLRLAGAKTNLPWRMSYPVHPELADSSRMYFPAIPLMVEENQWFYNSPIDDGAYSNLDQFSHRHNKGCNVGYLDGSAGWFRAPHGPTPDGITTAKDMCANDLLLETTRGRFPVGHSSPAEFGWANNPQ